MSDLKATSLMSQLGDGVTDRDALRKKFFNLDRKVSNLTTPTLTA